MKKNILILAIFAFIFSSCNDYLGADPENQQNSNEDVDYTDLSKMFTPVSGTYATARGGKGFSGWTLYALIAVRGADIDKGSTPTDQSEFNFGKTFQYSKMRDYWALNAAWENLYYMVQVCNNSLVSLDKYKEHITKDEDMKLNAQYQAEVRFFRAYAYFYISRLWGNVPVFTSNTKVEEGESKSSREEVLNFIADELQACITALPALHPNDMPYKGQITKYTAEALMAKVESDRNNWDQVLALTNSIISSDKFELYGDFYQAFKKPGRMSKESLFELQYSDFGSSSITIVEPDQWFAFQGPRGDIKGVNPIASGWGFMTPSLSIQKLFDGRGEKVRKKTTFILAGEATPDGDILATPVAGEPLAYNGKAYLPSTQLTDKIVKYGAGNNIRMLRYADILLLNAEAKVRKGQNGDAPFNLVRTRAEMGTLTNVTLDQVLEERRVEFACEWGENFFDLVRTDKAEGTLPNFVKGKSEYYPIPQAQIEMFPELAN